MMIDMMLVYYLLCWIKYLSNVCDFLYAGTG